MHPVAEDDFVICQNTPFGQTRACVAKLMSSTSSADDDLVLITLSEILFTLSQYTNFFKSKLTRLLRFLIDLPQYKKLVS